MTPVLALDLSNWTTGVAVPGAGATGLITADLVQCWRDQGFSHAIIGTQWPEVARHQLGVCHAAGMTLDLYSWLSWTRPSQRAYVASRQALAAGYPVRRHWLDVEGSAAGLSAENVCVQIDDAIAGLDGFPAGIYTGRYVWQELTGGATRFAHLPLWYADYMNQIPDVAAFKPFCGWQRPTVWQYAGSVDLCGANVDLNVCFEEEPSLANLTPDGSQRIESQGNFIVVVNKGVPVMRYGSADGRFPGRISKLFGANWLWLRTLDANGKLVAPYFSEIEGD
jgi:GH25 family lysozyme M1 (1,4-beta-N-acetylmuramidase)